MLKKALVSLLIIAVITVILSSCGSTNVSNNSNTDKPTISGSLSNEIFDFTISIDGTVYTLPAKLDDFKNSGWKYSFDENPETKEIKGEGYDTSTIENSNGRLTVTVVNNSGDVQLFSNCDVGGIDYSFSSVSNKCSIVVAKNLNVNSKTTYDAIKKAWGEPTAELNGQYGITLRYEKSAYVFYQYSFDNDGKITEFEARNWEPGSNNNTQELHPDYLDNYVKPVQLSEDIFSYVLRLQGDLYKLPAPVSEFTNNGWSIVSQVDHVAAGQEAVSGLRMSKNGVELTFNIKNFSDKQTSSNETMVTNVYVNSVFYPDVDFELSGGIKFGMTENEFISKIDVSSFEKSSFSGKTEYAYTTFSNHFYFTFNSDSKLAEVNIGKNTTD